MKFMEIYSYGSVDIAMQAYNYRLITKHKNKKIK